MGQPNTIEAHTIGQSSAKPQADSQSGVKPPEKNTHLPHQIIVDRQLFHVSELSLSLGLFEKREFTRKCSVAPSRLSQPTLALPREHEHDNSTSLNF